MDPSVANAPDPLCAACQYGKAYRKSHKADKGSIMSQHLHPGDGVSADQLEAAYPGGLPMTKGLPTTKRYKYCNIWVDHYSKYIFLTFHESKDASKLINPKRNSNPLHRDTMSVSNQSELTTGLTYLLPSRCCVTSIAKTSHSAQSVVIGRMVQQNNT